tara:strand:- start:245 stop:1450 length:1206 start_codon:yes stop_codon:yes gene_type:complete
MKRLFTLSLLLCTSIGVRAQDIPKELLKTWMPVLSTNYKGDTTYQEGPSFITFEQEGGHFELPEQKFTFNITQDRINFFLETGPKQSVKLIELQSDRLVLSYDSSMIITYIPLPNFEQKMDLSDINAIISDNIWSFRLPGARDDFFDFKMEFFDYLQDSGIVNYQYINLVKTVKFYPPSDFDQVLWYVDRHQNTFVIHIKQIFSSIFGLEKLAIKDIGNNKMDLVYWLAGQEVNITAHKWKKKSIHKQSKEIENLTRQAWRIQEEIIPPPIDTTGLMNLGYVVDDFLEYGEEYIYDSTSLIYQEDIDSHSLILKFDKTGGYKIYRESRVLDEGKWSMGFNNTLIQLNSDKEERLSDGVFGGYIQIKEIKRNKLMIYRSFENSLNHQIKAVESLLEVYRPIR